jgi:hypothetical protein
VIKASGDATSEAIVMAMIKLPERCELAWELDGSFEQAFSPGW